MSRIEKQPFTEKQFTLLLNPVERIANSFGQKQLCRVNLADVSVEIVANLHPYLRHGITDFDLDDERKTRRDIPHAFMSASD